MADEAGVALLEAARPQLIDAVVQAHLAHPYWLEHFGERGLRYTTEDTGHLFDRLLAALAFGDSVLADYGRWLQRLLTRHALCTLHLDESMRFMAESIEARLPGALAGECRALLEAGRQAMYYPPPTGDLQRSALTLAAALPPASPRALLDEVPYYLSFLTDATVRQDEAQLRVYLRWSAGYHAAAASQQQLLQLLGALGGALEAAGHLDAALLLAEAVGTLVQDDAGYWLHVPRTCSHRPRPPPDDQTFSAPSGCAPARSPTAARSRRRPPPPRPPHRPHGRTSQTP